MKVLASVVFCALVGLGRCQLPANQQDPCTTQSQVVVDATNCDRYWECVNGQQQLYDCPNGLVFAGKNRGIAEGCDYPWRGHYCQSKTKINAPITTAHCDWLYGIFGHETSCTRYWTCWNGTSTEQFCIGGLLYNEETHACDWPQNVAGCQKHPLCREDPNANVPLGNSCERYWSCQGGYPRLQRCPATLVFEKSSRRCLAPPTVDCDVLPPPPFQDDGIGEGSGIPRRNIPNRRRGSSSGAIRPRPNQLQQRPVNDQIHEQAIQQQRPRVRRPTINLPDLPAIPAGAIPISFDQHIPQRPQGGNLRPAPIEGAIPFN